MPAVLDPVDVQNIVDALLASNLGAAAHRIMYLSEDAGANNIRLTAYALSETPPPDDLYLVKLDVGALLGMTDFVPQPPGPNPPAEYRRFKQNALELAPACDCPSAAEIWTHPERTLTNTWTVSVSGTVTPNGLVVEGQVTPNP